MADTCLLALACLISYWFCHNDPRPNAPGTADDHLGGMWAVIATVFVLRHSYDTSIAAALSRMAATLVSFALCLAYLAFLPFHAWALAAIIVLSALTMALLGRPGNSITAAITTAIGGRGGRRGSLNRPAPGPSPHPPGLGDRIPWACDEERPDILIKGKAADSFVNTH